MTSRQWYCMVNGTQHGPIGEELLRQWIIEGRVGRADLVWSDPMGQWLPAMTALPEAFADVPPMVLSYQATFSGLPHNTCGTGGQTSDGQINAQARQALQGRWGAAILFCFLMFLIQGAISNLPLIGGIASLILSGPLELGVVIYFLTFTRRGQANLGMLFAGFKNFGNALGTYLLRALFVFLWLLLLIVPGIIMSLAYSQALYLLADNPAMGPMEALRRSKKMMQGHKARLCSLYFRYFGWGLLCMLPLFLVGIAAGSAGEELRIMLILLGVVPMIVGGLFLLPYMATGLAAFHNDLHAPVPVAAAAAQPVGTM